MFRILTFVGVYSVGASNPKRNLPLSDSDRGRFSLYVCSFDYFLTALQHRLPATWRATHILGCTLQRLPLWMCCLSGSGCSSGRCLHRGWRCVLRALAPKSRLRPALLPRIGSAELALPQRLRSGLGLGLRPAFGRHGHQLEPTRQWNVAM